MILSPGVSSQCQSLPQLSLLSDLTHTISLPPPTGFQVLLHPVKPFTCSGLLKELTVQTNGNYEFELQLWRLTDGRETFSNVWSVTYNPGVQDKSFRRIGKKNLQWRSRVGVPIKPGDAFGMYVSKAINGSMQITQYSDDGSTQSRLYYIESAGPLCNMVLCDKQVQTLDSITPLIKVTVFGKRVCIVFLV